MTAVEGAVEAALDDEDAAAFALAIVAAGGVVGTVVVEVEVTSSIEVTLTVFAKPEVDDGGAAFVVVGAGGMTVTASSAADTTAAAPDKQFAAPGRGAMTDLSRLRSLP